MGTVSKNGLVFEEGEKILVGHDWDECPAIISIPDSVEVIAEEAFMGCWDLMKVKFGKSVREICDRAFCQTGIQTITIPKTVEKLGVDAFTWPKVPAKTFVAWNGEVRVTAEAVCAPSEIKVQDGNQCYESDGRCLYHKVDAGKELILCYKTGIVEYEVVQNTTSIKGDVFSACSKLARIKLPESLISIEDGAFDGTKIGVIHIPSNVVSLGNNELNSLRTLAGTKIEIDPKNEVYSVEGDFIVKKLESNYKLLVCMQNERATSCVIPKGITHIAPGAFKGSKKLVNVTLPESVIEIGDEAFKACYALDSIEIPAGVTRIGEGGFANCTKLKNVIIRGADTELEKGVFKDCKKAIIAIGCVPGSIVEEYVKKSKLNSFPVSADSESNNTNSIPLLYSISNGEVTITGYIGKDGIVDIPAEIEGCPVKNIKKDIFRKNENITKVVWPSSMISIPEEVFWGCKNIESVDIPDTVVFIASKAFYNCEKLTSISLPSSVVRIHDEAFQIKVNNYPMGWVTGCCLKTIFGKKGSFAETFAENNKIPFVDESRVMKDNPDGILAESHHEVDGGYSLDLLLVNGDKMVIPAEIDGVPVVELSKNFNIDGVEECYGQTRINYKDLPKTVIISKSVKHIACQLYRRGIENLSVNPENTDIIVDGDFWYEEGGKLLYGIWRNSYPAEYTVLDGTERIDHGILNVAEGKDVHIPASVTKIEQQGISSLRKINVFGYPGTCAEEFAKLNGCPFFDENAAATMEFMIENGVLVKYVGRATEVVTPDGITEIGDHSFENCEKITSVIISEGVSVIGEHAFAHCTNLKTVKFPSTLRTIKNAAFGWVYSNMIEELDLPEGLEVIGEEAFTTVKKLKRITLPSTLKVIGSSGIGTSDEIKELELPTGLTKLGRFALVGWTELESIEIPLGVKSIHDTTFGTYGEDSKLRIIKGLGVESFETYGDGICKNPCIIVMPKAPFKVFKRTEDKYNMVMGYCAFPELYSGALADEYDKYARGQKKKIIEYAKANGFNEVLAFYGEE